jgi:hypothetical protein
VGSGAEGGGRIEVGAAHALGQDDAEAVEKGGLGGIGLGDAAQADIAMVGVGKTTSWDWMRASSSSTVRGELPRPALLPHL